MLSPLVEPEIDTGIWKLVFNGLRDNDKDLMNWLNRCPQDEVRSAVTYFSLSINLQYERLRVKAKHVLNLGLSQTKNRWELLCFLSSAEYLPYREIAMAIRDRVDCREAIFEAILEDSTKNGALEGNTSYIDGRDSNTVSSSRTY